LVNFLKESKLMAFGANVFYKCCRVFVYKILRKLVRQMTNNLKMNKSIPVVKKINFFLSMRLGCVSAGEFIKKIPINR